MNVLNRKSRGWCFTVFYNLTEDEVPEDYLTVDEKLDEAEYQVWQYEICPTTRRLHVQGYCYFQNARKGRSVQRLLAEKFGVEDQVPSLRIARGNAEQNKTYCTKEESRIFGPFEAGGIYSLISSLDFAGIIMPLNIYPSIENLNALLTGDPATPIEDDEFYWDIDWEIDL